MPPSPPPPMPCWTRPASTRSTFWAEPNPTTEFLFLAALGHDQEFAVAFGEVGLTTERIQNALRSDDLVPASEGENVEFRIQEPAGNVAAMRGRRQPEPLDGSVPRVLDVTAGLY